MPSDTQEGHTPLALASSTARRPSLRMSPPARASRRGRRSTPTRSSSAFRREAERRPLLVHRLRLAVDPAVAERLLDRRVVVDPRPPGRFFQCAPDTGSRGSRTHAASRRASSSTTGSVRRSRPPREISAERSRSGTSRRTTSARRRRQRPPPRRRRPGAARRDRMDVYRVHGAGRCAITAGLTVSGGRARRDVDARLCAVGS